MTIYYKDGFFNDENGGFVPENAVEISPEKYTALLEGQAQGKQIITDSTGKPTLIEPQPSLYHVLVDGEWVIDKDKQAEIKAQQQAEIWEQIKAKRTANGRGGVYVKSVDKWFHTDDNSRQQYTFMRTLPTIPPTPWKTMDNSFVTMTKELLDELSMAMFAHEQADFATAERHRVAMLQADNPQDYDYSTGWTNTYEEQSNG